jgi:hypothetical protein
MSALETLSMMAQKDEMLDECCKLMWGREEGRRRIYRRNFGRKKGEGMEKELIEC